ncbi:MAG: hypothetical protein COZ70_09430 [Deltaproteobacteria bacterium CG_4_8_14_3_um_filter_51_11]|nr:MAG: hypothetical protein COX16_14370 [Deltaproteobacteria bacterium CG23_combo_of_CG06-09_8_20_14_all_51_20]PIX19320.1 MAG: hypothetical protein COZ70_09430 [Deltaproteobacteria bacterium CG_4_8_14_3_um_filter_51_11]PIY25770.1 MAG: hypothetical protein COZ11_04455 [Deltaproteobacteria bacterium CG_4_10_14_3_um_filter_51_14]PJB34961.1 MAG: hypothetical protein CO107_12000 [Deltaproteobacteria bacterium CG_4_9_14_3_um_filter_51_14]
MHLDEESNAQPKRSGIRTRRKKAFVCSCCGKPVPFCWTCPCGFQICNRCMDENLWGLTCSGVNWQCPDCGSLRPF